MSRRPEIIVYLGGGSDYLIVGRRFCSCEAFLRGLARGAPGCKHVYGARIAMAEGRVRVAILSGDDLGRVVWEVLTGGLTRSLRRIVYRLEEDVGEHDYERVDAGGEDEG